MAQDEEIIIRIWNDLNTVKPDRIHTVNTLYCLVLRINIIWVAR
jgi:hypothetical protein